MKILSIRIKNLTSLAGEFEVDFEHGPLADTGLFAISGPTGAGKSTLLDALCLALYDATPRTELDKGNRVLLSEVDQPLGSNDVKNLLRRGAASGFAEVRFVGQDARRYRARWSVARARSKVDGKLQNQSLDLFDEEERSIGRTKTEVLAAIQERVGLSFDQFRRSILLAQGDFAAFLKARSEERSALLERMTGTDIYGQLSIRAYERYRSEEKAFELLEQQAKLQPSLSPEERLRHESELEQTSLRLTQLQQTKEQLARELRWWERLEELALRRREAEALSLSAKAKSDEVQPLREALTEVEAVQPLRPLADAARKAAQELEGAQKESRSASEELSFATQQQSAAQAELEKAQKAALEHSERESRLKPQLLEARDLDIRLEDSARELEATTQEESKLVVSIERTVSDLRTLAEKRTKAEAEQTEAALWLQTHPSAALIARNIDRIRQELDSHAELSRERQRLQLSLLKHKEDSERAESAQEHARLAFDEAQARLNTAQRRVELAEVQPPELSFESLSRRRSDIALESTEIERLERTLFEARKTMRELGEVRSFREQTSTGLRTLTLKATETEARVVELNQALKSTRALKEKALTLQSLDAHREKLRPGDPCPLCGSLDHPGISPPAQTTAFLEHSILEFENEKAQQESVLAGLKDEQARLSERLKKAAENEDSISTALEKTIAEWSDVLDDGSAETLALRREANGRALDALKKDEDTRSQREKEAAEARILRDTAQRLLAEAREALDQARTSSLELARQDGELTNALLRTRENLDAVLTRLAPLFDSREGWQEELASDPLTFRNRLESEAARTLEEERRHSQAEAAIRELTPQMAVLEERAKSLSDSLIRIRETLRQRGEEHGVWAHKRGLLLSGRAVAEVEAELERQGSEIRALLGSLQETYDSARSRSAAAHGRNEQARKALLLRSSDADSTDEALHRAAAESGLSLDALQERLARDSQWLETRRRTIQSAESELEKARAQLAARIEDEQKHISSTPPPEPKETLVLAHDAAGVEEEELTRSLGLTKALLAQDDELRKKAGELQKRIETQRQSLVLWSTMRELIGSADGKKFRTFAQSLTLEHLLAYANEHLRELAPRYRIERVPKHDMDLQIVDRDMGDEIRSVTSLSGGETFLVSLALALGLSSLASERLSIESLFIDEGFGSLDPQTLEVALAALDSLQSTGRKVGLISHVPGLAERIGARIELIPLGAGRSVLEVKAA